MNTNRRTAVTLRSDAGAALVLVAGLLMLFDVPQPMSPGAGLLSATVAVGAPYAAAVAGRG